MSKQPKVGQVIDYPEHRGFPSGRATISHVGDGKHMGRAFWWVTVRRTTKGPSGTVQAHFTFAYGRR